MKETIEKYCERTKIDEESLYNIKEEELQQLALKLEKDCSLDIIWTKSTRRLFNLVGECLKHKVWETIEQL